MTTVEHGIDIDEVLEHYIVAALWSTHNNRADEEAEEYDEDASENLDGDYDRSDIHPDTIAKMREDVEKFVNENHVDLRLWDGNTTVEQQAGHDFWLNRNGHGCGFWESEWTDLPTNPGDRLDKACKAFGEVYLYVGDDGVIYGD